MLQTFSLRELLSQTCDYQRKQTDETKNRSPLFLPVPPINE